MRKFSILLVFVYVTIFSLYNFVIAANPASPIVPGDNIQDPGDPGTAWGGCGPSDSNCYVTVSSEISGLDPASATNTINNGAYLQEWQWNTLAGTSGLKLSSTSTLAASNTQKLFEVSLSGANDNATQTTYAGYFSNTHTGTTSTNVGLYATASGGTANYAVESDGILLLDALPIQNIGTRSISIGAGTPSVTDSFFFGTNAGLTATGANNSIFIGPEAGELATNALNSVFLGFQSGEIASAADYSVFIGDQSGEDATNANEAVYVGRNAGQFATNAENSVFLGEDAGKNATNASESIFIGTAAGSGDTVSNNNTKYSILLGPATSTGGFSHSIAIGRGATNTDSNQLVIGSSTGNINYISNVFFGSGVTATSPVDYVINGSGASGTDIGGGDVTIAGGKATGNATGGSILFQTSNAGASSTTLQSLTTKMTILASGNVGISNTNPGVALHVGSSSTTDATTLLRLEDANSTCNFTADAGAPTCGSDRRLKTDIEELNTNDILENITSLNPVSYRWKTDAEDSPLQYGFIAQNVQEYFPNLVKEGTWIDGSQKLFLSMGGLMPYTVGAIKELDIKLKDIQDFEDENSSFGDRLRAWISNIESKISRIFVGELCLTEDGQESVCLNRGELKSLKELIQEPANSGNSPEEIIIEEEISEDLPTQTGGIVEDDILVEENVEEEIIEEEIPLEEVEDLPVQVEEIIEEQPVQEIIPEIINEE